ncbi:lysozyme [Acinetobacter sichuanensis]|uniref:lysozyme n=1 Tax=Acinetobacter sichuanensis TaxID=2136183 RepID=UPI00280DC687|nr:lysozyme [Acinetobacter sichuanensis]MDQ9019931.1 lysozyme [Acinetobacter sichuanensis]
MTNKQFFDEARKIAGGKLTQSQVDKLNVVVDDLSPKTTQTTSSAGIDLICSFEGLELEAYDDGVGVWTIGYGTTVINGVKVKKGDTCTVEQAKKYMASDLRKFEAAVNKVTVALNQNQFDALVSLTYNIGTGAFADSTLLKKLNAGDYKGAAAQFGVWVKAGGKRMQGLVNRRAVERKLFEKAV